ncbi:hypothetical protein PILCRDRAFT_824999 [Piloderma croceum F 1598]|uniref:NADP-dependent oxidoreductase domain-containing protein n=1 Tax=Piloderma croceum (strain F 1598) TaxID=765440 RepID=A0A0C3FDE8_PILCF|nr:hypothetical protein PILCRDRAFT_824999 [Piloderma croceum F 1598]
MTTEYNLAKQQLGRDGPKVPQLGFGLMGLSAYYAGAPSRQDALKLLDYAADSGCTFWDTSDIYGDNEDLIGEWFKKSGRRDEIFLATKFGFRTDESKLEVIGTAEYVHSACERSLKRLGVSTIDLYQQHRVDANTPIEITVRAMAELVKAGKVRYLGLSECSAATLRRAHAVHPITSVQVEYSPFSLDIEHEKINLLATCRELGVAVIAYSPLSRGLLTGKIRKYEDLEEGDARKDLPRFSKENFHKNLELVDKLDEIAKAKGVSSAQLVLAWIMAQGKDIFPIPGTTKIKYLEQNLGSLNVELSSAEEAQIRSVVNAADVAGGRYYDAVAALAFLDSAPLRD